MQKYEINYRDFFEISRARYHVIKTRTTTTTYTEIVANLTSDEYSNWIASTTFLGDGTELSGGLESLSNLIKIGIKKLINKGFNIDGTSYRIIDSITNCIKVSDSTLINSDFVETNLQYFPEKVGFNSETIVKNLDSEDIDTIIKTDQEYNKSSYIEKFLKHNVFTYSNDGTLDTETEYFGSLVSPEYELLLFPHDHSLNVKTIELLDDYLSEEESDSYWPENTVATIDFLKGVDESGEEFDTIDTSKVVSLYLSRELSDEDLTTKIKINLTYKLWKDDINGNPKMDNYVLRRDILGENENPVYNSRGLLYSHTSGNLLGNIKEESLPILTRKIESNQDEDNVFIWNKNKSYGVGERVKIKKSSSVIYESLIPNNLNNNPLLSYYWTNIKSLSELNTKYISVFCYEIGNEYAKEPGGYVSPTGIVKLDLNKSNNTFEKTFILYPDNKHEFKKIDDVYPVYDSINNGSTILVNEDDVNKHENGNVEIKIRDIRTSSLYFGYSLKSDYRFLTNVVLFRDLSELRLSNYSAKDLYTQFNTEKISTNYYTNGNILSVNPSLTYGDNYTIAAQPNSYGPSSFPTYYKFVKAVLRVIDENGLPQYSFLEVDNQVKASGKSWEFFSDPRGYIYDMNYINNVISYPEIIFFGVIKYNITVYVTSYPNTVLVEDERYIIDSNSRFILRFYFYDINPNLLPDSINIYKKSKSDHMFTYVSSLQKGTSNYTVDGLCYYEFENGFIEDTEIKITTD